MAGSSTSAGTASRVVNWKWYSTSGSATFDGDGSLIRPSLSTANSPVIEYAVT